MQQGLDANRQPRDKMRRGKAGKGEQRLGHPVLLRPSGRDGGFGRAVETVFDPGTGKHRDDAVRQHVEKIMQRMRAVAQRPGQHLGVKARQNARRAGEPDHRGREFGRAAVLLGFYRVDLSSRISEPRRRPEARRFGRIGGSCRTGQDAHGSIESEASRLSEQPRVGRAARPLHYSRTRIPARAGQAAARPGRPRSTTFVRANELTVACKARKRSSTAASKYSPALCHTPASNSRVMSTPRQKAPAREPGTRALPGFAVTPIKPSIAARVSADSRRS